MATSRDLREPMRAPISSLAEPVIERAEVVAESFNVSDIAAALEIGSNDSGRDDGEEEADEG